MAHMDIFNEDPFTLVTMSRNVNEYVDFQPTMVRELVNFNEVRIRTEVVSIEDKNGVLNLIQTSERGAPPPKRGPTEKRNMRYFDTPRITKQDTIQATEIANIREEGTESEFKQVQNEVARRLDGPAGILREVEMTWEHMALGAINGVVLDADGSTLYNYFEAFQKTPADPVDINFGVAADGSIRTSFSQLVDGMERSAKGLFRSASVAALCSPGYYDSLTASDEVRATYLNQQEARELRKGNRSGDRFTFGDVTFIRYRGTDDGTTISIPDGEARAFPINAPNIFEVYFSPMESLPLINTEGLPVYTAMIPDPSGRQMFVDVEAYSYPLFMCRRPEVLRRLRVA